MFGTGDLPYTPTSILVPVQTRPHGFCKHELQRMIPYAKHNLQTYNGHGGQGVPPSGNALEVLFAYHIHVQWGLPRTGNKGSQWSCLAFAYPSELKVLHCRFYLSMRNRDPHRENHIDLFTLRIVSFTRRNCWKALYAFKVTGRQILIKTHWGPFITVQQWFPIENIVNVTSNVLSQTLVVQMCTFHVLQLQTTYFVCRKRAWKVYGRRQQPLCPFILLTIGGRFLFDITKHTRTV